MPSSGFATPGWRQHALAGAVCFAGCALPGAARASDDVASAPHASELAVAPRAHFAAPSSFEPPIHELNERFRPTSLPAGRWALSTRAIAYVVDRLDDSWPEYARSEGVGLQADYLLPSIVWGVTDRLQINLTRPGISYRFGEDGKTEWLTTLQIPVLLSSAEPRGGLLGFALLARVDSRTWIASNSADRATTALALSLSAQTRIVTEGRSDVPDSAFEVYLLQTQMGVVHFVDSWLTLAPNVGFGVAFDTRIQGANTGVTLFSELARGVWSDPFARLHFARWASFDLFPSIGYEISTTTLILGGGGGFSFIW